MEKEIKDAIDSIAYDLSNITADFSTAKNFENRGLSLKEVVFAMLTELEAINEGIAETNHKLQCLCDEKGI